MLSAGVGETVRDDELSWLRERSMLARASDLARRWSGSARLWERPFAERQPRAAAAAASVWFTAYPAAILTAPGQSVLAALGAERLWEVFAEIGIAAVHTGPLKRAGGLRGLEWTPTVDGHFDRVGFEIDPAFGSEAEYGALVANAARHGAMVIGDIIPGHLGKGADFRLAERGVGEYPGLFHLLAIEPEDWGLLPPVPAGADAVGLSPEQVERLRARGYGVGELARVLLAEPGVKSSNWSATEVVRGADGCDRRWIYLHHFKQGQPALNWSDPSFAAHRLIIGDCLHALDELGVRMVRLDANGFLGVERDPAGGPAWSEGHPWSVTVNQIIAGMVRKLGGSSFQELNLTLDDLRAMGAGGADLSYDFISRPAYHHALVTGDARFLRTMLRLQRDYAIEPAELIHALQNHDELTLELVHFERRHAGATFALGEEQLTGAQLRDRVRAELKAGLVGPTAPYNREAANGIACTTASVAAAALGITALDALSAAQRADIQRLHLAATFFNAMQPGVLALSGWDLLGALPLSPAGLEPWLADGDTRWLNRGAYDLLGESDATHAASGLPRAPTLYAPLPDQLADPGSFVSQLRHILAVRARLRLAEARLTDLPDVQCPGLVVMTHELPNAAGTQVTAVNFAADPVEETVQLQARGTATDLLADGRPLPLSPTGQLRLRLPPHGCGGYLIEGSIEGSGL